METFYAGEARIVTTFAISSFASTEDFTSDNINADVSWNSRRKTRACYLAEEGG